MSKKVVSKPKSKALVKARGTLPAVKPWKSSTDLLNDINTNIRRFQEGRINCEEARIVVQSHRNAAALLALQLEHARQTNRLADKTANLPGFLLGDN